MNKPIFHAVLINSDRIGLGVITVPFPIPKEEYDHCVNLLLEVEIGDAARRDCYVEEVTGGWPVLKVLEGQYVNVDELDFLAKRLDTLADDGVAEEFLAMADKLKLTDINSLINLTFCCEQATVITDFSKLDEVGKRHYLSTHGGSCPMEEWERLDGEAIAYALIQSGEGTLTPYGVVYDNGMKLEQVYTGQNLPGFLYERYNLALAVTPKDGLKEGESPVFLYFPSPQMQIDRALQRGGITGIEDTRLEIDLNDLPDTVSKEIELGNEPLEDLNRMCAALIRLDQGQLDKLDAVVECAEPSSASQVVCLAENLELFDFAPHAKTPEEVGEYMVKESGHYEYDPNLEGFYDYKKLGEQRMKEHPGCFAEKGYISYEGAMRLDELMEGKQEQSQQMF